MPVVLVNLRLSKQLSHSRVMGSWSDKTFSPELPTGITTSQLRKAQMTTLCFLALYATITKEMGRSRRGELVRGRTQLIVLRANKLAKIKAFAV